MKKIICCLLTCALSFTLSISVLAAQKTVESSEISHAVSSRGVGYGSVIYPQGNRVTINRGYVDTVSYTGVCTGKTGVIVLRFTNVNNGDIKDWTFICDNSYHVAQMSALIPAGTYTISSPTSTVTGLISLSINFS